MPFLCRSLPRKKSDRSSVAKEEARYRVATKRGTSLVTKEEVRCSSAANKEERCFFHKVSDLV